MSKAKVKMKRVKKVVENQYLDAFGVFKQQLRLLRMLNKELAQFIKDVQEGKKWALDEKFRKMDKKTKTKFFKNLKPLLKLLEKSLDEKSDTTRVSMTLKSNHAKLLQEVIDAIIIPMRFDRFIRDMSLVYLITQFESFLQEVLEISFSKKPETLTSSQKSLTFEELLKFEDFESVKRQIIEKESSSIINQDIADINVYFTQKFGLDFSQFVDWKKFKERFYRRNILIHNSGVTNRIYRLKTGYKGKNKTMTVSRNYLSQSINLFDTMGSEISKHLNSKLE